jgi:hypothetical protein
MPTSSCLLELVCVRSLAAATRSTMRLCMLSLRLTALHKTGTRTDAATLRPRAQGATQAGALLQQCAQHNAALHQSKCHIVTMSEPVDLTQAHPQGTLLAGSTSSMHGTAQSGKLVD